MVVAIVVAVSLLVIGLLTFKISGLEKQVKVKSSGHIAVEAERDELLDVKKDLIETGHILNQRIDSLEAINRIINERRTDLEYEIKKLNSHIVQLEDVVERRNRQIENLTDKVAALENPPVLVDPQPEAQGIKSNIVLDEEPQPLGKVKIAVKKGVRKKK